MQLSILYLIGLFITASSFLDRVKCRIIYKNNYHTSSYHVTSSDHMKWDPKSAPKLDFNEDYYKVIEIDPTCTQQELKRAYYKIVFKFHPDNKESEEAKRLCNQQMMVINAGNKYIILFFCLLQS